MKITIPDNAADAAYLIFAFIYFLFGLLLIGSGLYLLWRVNPAITVGVCFIWAGYGLLSNWSDEPPPSGPYQWPKEPK